MKTHFHYEIQMIPIIPVLLLIFFGFVVIRISFIHLSKNTLKSVAVSACTRQPEIHVVAECLSKAVSNPFKET